MIDREDCIKIGDISKTHGLQGSVVIITDSDLIEKYMDQPVFLLMDGAPVPFFIQEEGVSFRNHSSYIVKFLYVDTLRQAERLMGAEVLMEKELLDEEDVQGFDFDISELNGFDVEEQVSGERGKVTDVVDYSGNVVLTLQIFGKEVLLPLSESYVKEVDLENSRLYVCIPSEIVDLN